MSRGWLIAALALIVIGLLGAGSTAALMVATDGGGARDDGRFDRRQPGERAMPREEPRDAPQDSPREERQFEPRDRGPYSFDLDEFDTLGERIFVSGFGSEGPIPREPSYGPAMMGGCAVCHGRDGQGSRFFMMGIEFDAPPITYQALTSEHEEDGETEPGWSDEEILAAIREGETPSGDRLRTTMPRWDITQGDFDALLEYLKTLE